MSNAQSIDSLRELNAKLLAEIAKLRKENAERAELKARIAELLKQGVEENKNRDAENAELKARIIELEKNKTVTTKLESENAEFRDRITKVEQRQMQNDNITKVCFNKEEQVPEVSLANIPDSDIAQPKHHTPVYEAKVIVPEITVPTSPLLCKDDRKTDEFLDMVQKKSVSNRIRQRNKEKKIQRESVNQDIISEPTYVAETDSDDNNSKEPSDRSILEKSEISRNFVNKIHNFHDQNIDKSIKDNQLDCNLSKNDSSGDDDFTVPSEQVVERDLMQQLSLPSTSIDTEIPLTPPVIDKKQQFSVTAEKL
ncbi:hypothetical protein C1645_840321 [Glomus cerebriforme]|uniref:Spindle pole body component Bbp1 C-terminal domain-containing protein n=1 Tax=Glomus cerebriforme TaxID=658196 RepID=A0A397S5J5_9GLOM|nr:hypothetical protein C1645_840321 [Glomus cerebriforme]